MEWGRQIQGKLRFVFADGNPFIRLTTTSLREIAMLWSTGVMLAASFVQPAAPPAAQVLQVANQFAEVDRVWLGPNYYANRLQDWRIHDGRLEATTGSAAKPMRVVQLLTTTLAEVPGTLTMSVRTGPREPESGQVPADSQRTGTALQHTWSGFLVGAGGDSVDYRISALVHHWPAPDGGLIIGVDGTGAIIVRDNASGESSRRPAANIPLTAWPLIAPTESEQHGVSSDMVLDITAEPNGTGGYRLTVRATDYATHRVIARAVYPDLESAHFSGNVALVSHHARSLQGRGYWFSDWVMSGTKLRNHPERSFGPIMGTLYSLSRGVLRMTAQFGPLGPEDAPEARLETLQHGTWVEVARATIVEDSWTAHFRVPDWDATRDVPYRVVYALRQTPAAAEEHRYAGTIRREPLGQRKIVLGVINCVHPNAAGSGAWNGTGFWHPHADITQAMSYHNPDLLFFSGDQIYEGAPFGVVRAPEAEAMLDYLNAWYLWVWSFRDLTRDRPALVTPDDHDVFHGNIWGAGGILAEGPLRPVADNGGYLMSARWVNAVHRTQTWSLPDPVDPAPIARGISVYHTSMEYAGLSLAVVADRMFKSPPSVLLPEANIVNGWSQNPDFDPERSADVPGAELLGARQMAFLDRWAADWRQGTWMKVLLSQTLFANLATLPAEASSGAAIPSLRYAEPGEYIEGDRKAADFDSNGWPQSGRNAVLRTIRRAFAMHIGGDQHLGSVLRHGIDAFDDAGYSFIVPAAGNLWPRRWFPPDSGSGRSPGAPRYTGQFLDGFGNHMTVLAASNPVKSGHEPTALYDRVPGYGIVRFDRVTRDITMEAWPRWVDPAAPQPHLYAGWPITINQLDNDGRAAVAQLPELQFSGMEDPVVQLVDEANGEVVYTLRIAGTRFTPKVFTPTGSYTLIVGEPGTARTRTLRGIQPAAPGTMLPVIF